MVYGGVWWRGRGENLGHTSWRNGASASPIAMCAAASCSLSKETSTIGTSARGNASIMGTNTL